MRNWQDGFTLVELLIGMLVAVLLGGAIINLFIRNSQAQVTERDVVAMQQDLRAALLFMGRELRDAAYDPTEAANARIESSTATSIYYTVDNTTTAGNYNADGDGLIDGPDEHREFTYNVATNTLSFARGTNPTPFLGPVPNPVVLIQNVEDIEFLYLVKNGNNFLTTTAPTLDQRSNIRAVQISLLIRSPNPQQGYVDQRGYFIDAAGDNWGPYNDVFRRRFGTTTIRLRNLRDG